MTSSSNTLVEFYIEGLNGTDDEPDEEEYVPSSMDKTICERTRALAFALVDGK